MRAIIRWIGLLCLALLATPAFSASDLASRDPLFNGADAARTRAVDAQGELLAPNLFRRSMDAFRKAEEVAEDGGKRERIRELLAQSSNGFAQVEEASLRARELLTDAIAARRDAESAGARSADNDLWMDGESELRAATTRLERNRDADIAKYREKAVQYFRQAELGAIETTLFAEAQRQIAIADDLRASRDAPKGFAEAEALLLQARTTLAQDRYDTDQPRDNATLATHNALRAQYIAQSAKQLDRGDITLEDFVATWEKELTNLGDLIDQTVYFDRGPGEAGTVLANAVADLLLSRSRLEEQVAEQQRYAIALQQEIETLQTDLGGQSQARARLQAELERKGKLKEKVRLVESLFKPAEAQVLRVQDRLVLRMVGVTFGSGQSVLEGRHHGLLGKVRKALAEFPDAPIIVEGHTDSHGADAANLDLSKARADAVMRYLLSGGGIAKELLTAVGYGETQPISSNESPEGRQKNRRIDVVLYPQW